MAKVFIDGQAGTTGIELAERLRARSDLELLEIDAENRKDAETRRALLNEADVAILCLPDDAARDAVALADGGTRILDASTAYRTADGWAYGLPELEPGMRARIQNAQFVSNPGCYPQGFILFVRPLIDAGLLSPQTPLRCHAVSGYSGGGRQMIEAHAAFDSAEADRLSVQAYALGLAHKHVPEMQRYSHTGVMPLFAPSVAHYYKGMLVEVPLFTSELGGATPQTVHGVLQERYAEEPFVTVLPYGEDGSDNGYLNPTGCNNSNRLELMVLGNATQLRLIARYDNLGKGAAGAAVQNLNLMLGVAEDTSL